MIAARGYRVLGVDSISSDGSGSTVRGTHPPLVYGFRPDVWAYSDAGDFVIGEAKTEGDIDTAHTRAQLAAFASWCREDRADHLYIAVPRSAARSLDRMLGEVHLLACPVVRRLHIPDCLLECDDGS
jgi:hypothetical protein